jgi:hypothetical protein
MKRIYLFSTIIWAVLFTACTEDFNKDVAPPQSNPQEPEQTVGGFTFTLGDDVKEAIVLTEGLLTGNKSYNVVKNTAAPQLKEGATIKYRIEVSKTTDLSGAIAIASTSENNAASITATDLDEAVKSLYGKAPESRDLYLKVYYYTVDGTNSLLMPATATLGPVLVTPVAPVIETGYYVIGDVNGWSFDNLDAYRFNHSGKDVYEDGVFSLLVEFKQPVSGDFSGYFKIVPKSSKDAGSWDGVIGNPVDGNAGTEGTLIIEGNQAMRVLEPGWVMITLNMMEYTYKIELLGEMKLELYVAGSHQGWSPETAPALYTRNLDRRYEGYVYFSTGDEFKFTSERSWGGTNYGESGVEGTLSDDGGAGNLKSKGTGVYKLNVDLTVSPAAYTALPTEWGLIGSATGGGWDNSTAMAYDRETNLWTVTTILTAGEFKFRANNGWDINLGGNLDNLSYGGDNIVTVEAGTYKVTLDLSEASAYRCTLVKQ